MNSPGEFYLQSPSYLDEVQPLLANLPSSLKSKSEFAVGDMCLAPFQGDRWFRGRVERAEESRFFEVLYVDYGNRGMVAAGELTAMPQSLQKFPPQVLKGELAGVVPLDGRTWGMEASVYFSSLVLDKHVTAKVQVRWDQKQNKTNFFGHIFLKISIVVFLRVLFLHTQSWCLILARLTKILLSLQQNLALPMCDC